MEEQPLVQCAGNEEVIWDMNGNGLPVSGTQRTEGRRRLTDRWYRLAGMVGGGLLKKRKTLQN